MGSSTSKFKNSDLTIIDDKLSIKIINNMTKKQIKLEKIKNLSTGSFGDVSKYHDEENGKFLIVKRYFNKKIYCELELYLNQIRQDQKKDKIFREIIKGDYYYYKGLIIYPYLAGETITEFMKKEHNLSNIEKLKTNILISYNDFIYNNLFHGDIKEDNILIDHLENCYFCDFDNVITQFGCNQCLFANQSYYDEECSNKYQDLLAIEKMTNKYKLRYINKLLKKITKYEEENNNKK